MSTCNGESRAGNSFFVDVDDCTRMYDYCMIVVMFSVDICANWFSFDICATLQNTTGGVFFCSELTARG